MAESHKHDIKFFELLKSCLQIMAIRDLDRTPTESAKYYMCSRYVDAGEFWRKRDDKEMYVAAVHDYLDERVKPKSES